MQSYIGFLRGINVGGQKKIKMGDLLVVLAQNGLPNVKTYIQSGNLIIPSNEQKDSVRAIIQDCLKNDFGFEVPTIIKTQHEISKILSSIPFENEVEKQLYFTLLHQKPNVDLVTAFEKCTYENEDFQIVGQCVYLNCKKGAGKAKLNNNLIEQKLKVTGTTRNLNTMRKMLDLAQQAL